MGKNHVIERILGALEVVDQEFFYVKHSSIVQILKACFNIEHDPELCVCHVI